MKHESGEKRGKSRYAKKLARKLGRGTVNPLWMWWVQAGDRPGAPPVYRGNS